MCGTKSYPRTTQKADRIRFQCAAFGQLAVRCSLQTGQSIQHVSTDSRCTRRPLPPSQ